MPTCPNCGEIIMNGDPYCSHCGTALRWETSTYETINNRSFDKRIIDRPISQFQSDVRNMFLNSPTADAILGDIDISEVSDATYTIIRDFPIDDIKIHFKRSNRYFTTEDRILYDTIANRISGYNFFSYFIPLEKTEWFKKEIEKKDQKYYRCGGGYDAHWDWQRSKFQLKKGCSVIAHFHEDRYNTRGYEVDFKNHRLKSTSEKYERATPYDVVSDYDWYDY